ncbi:DUF4215 domain-containing protein, partial [Patescibacteria group bacterium]|nr:DUF4215 domain-containing protein [Patescibacteria group bacterium]
MKHFKLIEDTFKNRIIVSLLAILVFSLFNIWFSYKDQIPLKAALASQTFYIDNQLGAYCTNYVVASRSCGVSSGIEAWPSFKDGLVAIKALQDNTTIEIGGHTIYIREGTYYGRITTWPFGASDDRRNTIRAYNSEKVIASGAVILDDWQAVGSDVYTSADISSVVNYFENRKIYQDGEILTEAHYPNSGSFMIDARGDGTYIEDAELIDLYNQSPELVIDATVEFLGRDLYGDRHKIESVDTQTGRAYFYADDVLSAGPYTDAIYHLMGKIEYLDQAGEFYYQINESTEAGELVYLKFASGDTPGNHLLEIQGEEVFRFGYGTNRPAYYLNLINIELKHGTQGVMLDGDRAMFSAHSNDFVHHITFDNVDSYDHARFGYVSGGSAHHIVIKNSLIENNQLTGLYLNGFIKPVCGDGVLDNWLISSDYETNPEQCDDGNTTNGDGCSSMCGLSGGYDGRAVEPWDDYYKAYFTVQNNTIRNNKSNGLAFNYLAQGIISGNTLEYNGAHSANSGMGFQKGSDNQIFNNSVSYQGGNGILLEGSFNSKLRRFDVYSNTVRYSSYNNHPNISAYFAIWLDETDGINVYDNTFYAENGRGFAIGGTDNSKIIRNKFLDIFSGVEDSERRKADAGYMYDGEGQTLKNNVIAHNIFAGKIAMGLDMLAQNTDTSLSSMINNKVVNNIFYSTRSDKVQMNDLAIDIDHSSNVYQNNIYYAPSASSIVYIYQDEEYPSLAAFRTASGNQESSSLQTNPLFTDFASNNFNLQSNSPAIDSAMTLAGINNTTYQGQGPDIGLLEYASGPTCGNYLTESGEQCDDGDTSNGDGCSSSCQTEVAPGNNGGGGGGGGGGQGGTPPPPVEVEPEVVCGNAIEEEGETCDDGN